MHCYYPQGGTPQISVLPPKPATVAQAMKSNHCEEWKKAMIEEINSLLKNKTWTFEKLPPLRTIVKNKWIFKIKVEFSGEIEHFKAWLVAKGFFDL